MNKNKTTIESLSMDLMRVAIGLHRKSYKMADRFSDETLKRVSEIKKSEVKPYFARILEKITLSLSDKNINRKAEDALMYSVRCKNYAKHFA